MQKRWKIGSLFGIPLYIDPLWFIILGLATWNFGSSYQQLGTTVGWTVGIVMALLLFTSVLLHELGHSLAAKSQGIKVSSITLFLFGGMAMIEEESKTPNQAFQVAIAGPAVSIILFLLFKSVSTAFSDTSIISQITNDLAGINLVLALFNLIPGLPLDGGQVLKAALWKATGNQFKAVRGAAIAGQVLGYSAIAFSFVLDYYTQDLFTGLWIMLLGWFAIRNATSYQRVATLQETLVNTIASETMTRDFRVIDAKQSLRTFADAYLLENNRQQIYFADADGRYQGLVIPEKLQLIEISEWETQTVQNIVTPLTEIPTVAESTSLVQIIKNLETQELSHITVLSPAGSVAGIIDKGDIVRTLAQKLKLKITDSDIKNIKADRNYPPGLQLDNLAKSIVN
jgi:Zn-dependent protease/predicted transcriptional regulator